MEKIATYKGLSKWITGEQARENVHADRHRYAAIMVGVGTVIADNPMLDCRSTAVAIHTTTIIATCSTDSDRKSLYENAGCEVIITKESEQHVDLKELMNILGEKRVSTA